MQGDIPQVPPTDTIWGMMDSEERQDHYKLIRGLLLMYPYFLNPKVNKKKIKDMMIFIIKTITTPFNEKIRGGKPHEKGASQITKYSGAGESKTDSDGASKVGSDGASKVGPNQAGYYTLSEGVASQIAPLITAAGHSAEIARDYQEMLHSVYGMGNGEIKDCTNYPFKKPNSGKAVKKWKGLITVQGGGNKLKKKKSHKKRKRKRRKKLEERKRKKKK